MRPSRTSPGTTRSSGRRSATRSPTSAPPELRFFVDRDLCSHTFLRWLREASIPHEPHGAHFRDDTPDHVWLADVGKRGWVIVTHDANIRRRGRELDAVMLAEARMFVLRGAAPMAVLAENFVRTYPAILRFLENHPEPFIAKLYRPRRPGPSGRVEMSLSYETWRGWGREASRRPRSR